MDSKLGFSLSPWLLTLLMLGVLVYFGSAALRLETDNRIDAFAVHHHPSAEDWQLFKANFPERSIVLISLEFPNLEPEALRVAGREVLTVLADLEDVRLLSEAQWPDAAEGTASGDPVFPFLVVEQRLYNVILEIQDPRKQGAVVSTAESALNAEASRRGDFVVRLAGEPVVNHRLSDGTLEVKERLFPILIVLCLGLLSFLFRDPASAIATLLQIGGSVTTAVGIIALSGEKLNLVTTLIPSLVFILATAMQVHFLMAAATRGGVVQGVRAKLKPNLLVSLTTSIGFGSLMLSEVPPIAALGRHMAVDMWIIFAWTTLTPLGPGRLMRMQPKSPKLALSEFYAFLATRLTASSKTWLLIPCLAILVGAFFLAKNPVESNGLNYFHPDSTIRRHSDFCQTYVTGGSHLEILVVADESADGETAFMPELEQLEAFEAWLLMEGSVRHIFSLNRIAGALEESESEPGDTVMDILDELAHPGFYRIIVLVDSLNADQYYQLRENIFKAGAPFQGEEGKGLIVTGPLDRIIHIQDYLLQSLGRSLGLTVLLVILLMTLALGRKHPTAFFIPNLFPLGCMALFAVLAGFPTTVSSVMVFSAAFGIAVDDTIHLINTYQKFPRLPYRDRLVAVFQRDGTAVLLTSVVLTLGFGVLTLSDFLPTQRFGILLSVGMMSAFIGDLCFLPLLLRKKTDNQAVQT